MIGNRLVQLELNSAQPVRDVGVVDALDKDLPRVRVIVGNTGRLRILVAKGLSRSAVDEGPLYLTALDAPSGATRGSHGAVMVMRDVEVLKFSSYAAGFSGCPQVASSFPPRAAACSDSPSRLVRPYWPSWGLATADHGESGLHPGLAGCAWATLRIWCSLKV